MVRLSPRLLSASGLCRTDARMLDVGTDHAYLPIALIQNGTVTSAMASDVVPGPLARAKEHLEKEGLADKVMLRLCAGLDGWEAYAPTDIFILGMGGELIADILDKAPWIKKNGIRLVLQPMSKAADLRAYLFKNGFEIDDEVLAAEEDRVYQIFSATYTGAVTSATAAELAVGQTEKHKDETLYEKLVAHELDVLSRRLDGLRQSKNTKDGTSLAAYEHLKNELEEILK